MRNRLVAILAFAAVLLAGLPGVAAPLRVPVPPREGLVSPAAPSVTAESWIVYDADAGVVLAAHNADEERPQASTTKIMTALVALKYGDLDDIVTVSTRAADVGEAEIGLHPGEQLPLRLLLTALMVRSANDAAMAVAEHIGGSVEGFADMMNAEAEALGLEHTHFDNPHGLDGQDHYSSARDLLKTALAAMSYPEFREMAATTEMPFPEAPDGTERKIVATNHLLEEYPGAIGIKTGYTGRAGLVLVGAAVREGRTVFTVVMGSEGSGAHFDDTATLLDWAFERFRSVAMLSTGEYEPPDPVRVVEDDPVPEPEPEPVVVTRTWEVEEPPPQLLDAFTWMGRLVGAGESG